MNDTATPTTATVEPKSVELLEPDPGAPLAPRPAGSAAAAHARRAVGAELMPQAGVVLQTSETVSKIFGALAKAQGQFATVDKTRLAKIDSREEGRRSFTYTYETLADVLDIIRKPLSDNAVVVMQFPSRKGNELMMRTLLAHESGEWISSDTTFVLAGTSPQAIGSGIQYARRYTLKSILGLAADDDDDDGTAAEREHDQRDHREEPPRPARRASERAASTGVIKAVEPSTVNGVEVWAVVLDTGFRCGTRDEFMAAAARNVIGHRRELVTRASSDPSRFMPALLEILPVHD